MPQNAPTIRIATGGGLAHAKAILTASYYMIKNGWKLENPDWLATKSMCPGVPDVYCSKVEKGTKYYAVIELESKTSSKADTQKYIQFEATTKGHKVYIIHLDECSDPNNSLVMDKFIKDRLP